MTGAEFRPGMSDSELAAWVDSLTADEAALAMSLLRMRLEVMSLIGGW